MEHTFCCPSFCLPGVIEVLTVKQNKQNMRAIENMVKHGKPIINEKKLFWLLKWCFELIDTTVTLNKYKVTFKE